MHAHMQARYFTGLKHVTLDVLHMGFLRVTRVTSFLERVAWSHTWRFLKKAPLRGYDSSDYLGWLSGNSG